MHTKILELITNDWFDLSVELKRDHETDGCFGWVLEMWGYTITCARHGVKHNVIQQLQIEPASSWRQNVSGENPYIYHYTFGLEYTHDGLPMVGQSGEWSFDKRQYFGAFPPSTMAEPPECAHEAAHVLTALFNEGSAASPPWKAKAIHPQRDTTRKTPPPPFDESSPAYRAVVGTGPWELTSPAYRGKGANAFFFFEKGRMHTPIGAANWRPSDDGQEVMLDFCGNHAHKLEAGEDGQPVLRGDKYTFTLAKSQVPLKQMGDAAMWQAPLAKRIIGRGPYAWGAHISLISNL
jgi:hypothetical protein